jgi:hypothetical protein
MNDAMKMHKLMQDARTERANSTKQHPGTVGNMEFVNKK